MSQYNILIIDNYDSFTFNLYQMIGEIFNERHISNQGQQISFRLLVKRNNEISISDILTLNPTHIVISPGPGHPADPDYFGICSQVLQKLSPNIPTLGICLGMQGIVHAFGGKVVQASVPMHGKISTVQHNNSGILNNLPAHFDVMRYHSLVADPGSLPNSLIITAETIEPDAKQPKEIMAIAHQQYPIYGIQFHPESFATEGGKEIIKNFILQN